MSVTDVLMDFAIASLLILVGQLIRAKVRIVQKFFIPASMIAGFIALALGKQGANILPFSKSIGSYAGILIIIVFAAVGMNGFSVSKSNFKAELDRVGSYFSYKVLAQAIQFCLGPLFSILVISKLFPQISYGFGLCLAAGFSGGHGTAAAVGSVFKKLGKDFGKDAFNFFPVSFCIKLMAYVENTFLLNNKTEWNIISTFSQSGGNLHNGIIIEFCGGGVCTYDSSTVIVMHTDCQIYLSAYNFFTDQLSQAGFKRIQK